MAKNQRNPRPSGQSGKTGSSGKTAAQRRLEAQRAVAAASASASAKRRKRMLVFYAPIAVLLIVVLVLVLVSVAGGGNDHPANTASAAPAAIAAKVTSVPATVLDQVGAGTSSSPPVATGGGALTQGGKPRVLYVGAEWCPFCAAERWALVVALSRFGTFTGLGITKSSPNDVHPNTPTLTFQGSTYTSDYLVFDGVELQDGDHNTINTLSASDAQLFNTLGGSSFPFVDLGGTYALPAAQYAPDALKGKTHEQVADALSDPNSDIAQDIVGSANVLTATICRLTGNKPAGVCSSAGVTAAAAKLP